MTKSSCAKHSVFRGKIIIFLNSIYGYLNNGHLHESSIDRHTKLTAGTFVVEVIFASAYFMPGSIRCYETFRAALDVRHAAVAVALAWLFHCLYKMRRTTKIRAGWSKRQLTGRGGVRRLSLAKYTIQSENNCSLIRGYL